jgi:hypothetical protein
MALAADRSFSDIRANDEESLRSSNDALSFWKLPEDWRARVATSIDKSRTQAEYFLFEQYLSFEDELRSARSMPRGRVGQFASNLSSRFEIPRRAHLSFPCWLCAGDFRENAHSYWIERAGTCDPTT